MKEPPGTTVLTYEHSGGWVNTLAWSPDGTRVASVSWEVQVWQVR